MSLKNNTINKSKVVFTLEQLKDFCKLGKVRKSKENLFVDIFFDNCFYKIFEGAKSSGKTFSICAFFIYLLINEPNWNGVVIRKYSSDHKTKTFRTFEKVARILDEKYNCNLINNLSFSQYKTHTEIEYQKKIIAFLSLSSTSNIGGITCPFGGFGGIFIDEIVEFKDTNYLDNDRIQLEKDGLKMIIDTCIRGNEYNGKHKFLITASNGWNENHWFTKEFVKENLILDSANIRKLEKDNFLYYTNKKFNEKMGITICKITTWVNIHKNKEELKKAKALKQSDINYYNASVLGLYYKFLYNNLIYANYLEYIDFMKKDFITKNLRYIRYVIWCSDWGKNDATVLMCILITMNLNYKIEEIVVYRDIEIKNSKIKQQDKIKYFVEIIKDFYNEFPQLIQEKNYYWIDCKEYTIIELMKDKLWEENIDFIYVRPSIKNNNLWNIKNRITTVISMICSGKFYVSQECEPLMKELQNCVYNQNWERDEIHCKLDNINSLEYGIASIYEYLV